MAHITADDIFKSLHESLLCGFPVYNRSYDTIYSIVCQEKGHIVENVIVFAKISQLFGQRKGQEYLRANGWGW